MRAIERTKRRSQKAIDKKKKKFQLVRVQLLIFVCLFVLKGNVQSK